MAALAVLGLGEVEEQVYEALVLSSTGQADDVARDVRLPRATVLAALRSLVGRGFAVSDPDVPTRFTPTPIEVSVEALVRSHHEALGRARAQVRDLTGRSAQPAENRRPQQLVEVLVGREAIADRFLQLARGARDEVLTLDRPPYGGGADHEVPYDLAGLPAPVRRRTVYDRALLEDEGCVTRIREELTTGGEGRVLPELPLQAAVFDRQLALLPLLAEGPDTGSAALVVMPSVLLESLVLLFETIWRIAIPVPKRLIARDVDDDRELRATLGLLATGMTDERIARHLNVSERTVRRRVAEALVRLGAETRFQAGMRAREAGWL